MRELLTGDDLFSEIVMRRTADPRTVIVLEGPSDCVTLDIFLDDTSCYSIDANGKSSVLRVIECSETTSTKRVLGVVDNDAELPARWPHSDHPRNLVWTEYYDLDAEVLYAGTVFERLVASHGDRDKLASSSLEERRDALERLAAPISLLGQLSRQHRLELVVANHPLHASINVDRLTVDVARMVTITKAKSVGCRVSVGEVVALVNSALTSSTPSALLNGHRLFDALALLLGSRWGSLSLTGAGLERIARAALTYADLQTTAVHDRITSWGVEAGTR